MDRPLTPNDAAPEPPPAPGTPAARLAAEPYRFEFFQAVRVLERVRSDRAPAAGAPPDGEPCRFRSHATASFPASQLQSLTPRPDASPVLVVNFFGLIGPSGALPDAYTHHVIERLQSRPQRKRDATLHDFLDLFTHRLVGLFHRAWRKYRGWVGYEEASRLERRRSLEGPARLRAFTFAERETVDPVSQAVLDVAGLGEPALRYRGEVRERLAPRTALPDDTLRFLSGLLSQRHRSAAGLEAALDAAFGLPARLRQLCGRWLILDEAERSRAGTQKCELGVSTVVGRRVWEAQGKFRVVIGPLRFAEFVSCLPAGDTYRPLTELIRLYAGLHLDFDVELRLVAEDVPECRPRTRPGGPRLGWTTWLLSRPLAADYAAVTLVPREAT